MLQNIFRGLGVLSLGTVCFLEFCFAVQNWCLFFLNKPSRSMPGWVSRLSLFLWLPAIPWGIATIWQSGKNLPRVYNLSVEFWAFGILVSVCLLCLIARFLTSEDEKGVSG